MKESRIKPVYAEAFFKVSKDDITYYLIFEYLDEEGYYEKLFRKEEELDKEMNKLYYNMQSFLDEEKVTINGKRCKPKVRMVDLNFRGSYDRVSIVFLISFPVKLKEGVNYYENEYASELVEYDYKAYWFFPEGSEIIEVDMKEDYEILDKRILVIYGKKGKRSSGYEMISFKIS